MSFFFDSHDNEYKTCLSDSSGLDINANHLWSENMFGHHPVKFKGVIIGDYEISSVTNDGQALVALHIPERFSIPNDSTVITETDSRPYKTTHYLSILPGSSEVLMKNGDEFLNSCVKTSSYRLTK